MHIVIWGQQHDYLRINKRAFLYELQLNGKIYEYLANIDRQSAEMIERLVEKMAIAEVITEQMKTASHILWVSSRKLSPL